MEENASAAATRASSVDEGSEARGLASREDREMSMAESYEWAVKLEMEKRQKRADAEAEVKRNIQAAQMEQDRIRRGLQDEINLHSRVAAESMEKIGIQDELIVTLQHEIEALDREGRRLASELKEKDLIRQRLDHSLAELDLKNQGLTEKTVLTDIANRDLKEEVLLYRGLLANLNQTLLWSCSALSVVILICLLYIFCFLATYEQPSQASPQQTFHTAFPHLPLPSFNVISSNFSLPVTTTAAAKVDQEDTHGPLSLASSNTMTTHAKTKDEPDDAEGRGSDTSTEVEAPAARDDVVVPLITQDSQSTIVYIEESERGLNMSSRLVSHFRNVLEVHDQIWGCPELKSVVGSAHCIATKPMVLQTLNKLDQCEKSAQQLRDELLKLCTNMKGWSRNETDSSLGANIEQVKQKADSLSACITNTVADCWRTQRNMKMERGNVIKWLGRITAHRYNPTWLDRRLKPVEMAELDGLHRRVPAMTDHLEQLNVCEAYGIHQINVKLYGAYVHHLGKTLSKVGGDEEISLRSDFFDDFVVETEWILPTVDGVALGDYYDSL